MGQNIYPWGITQDLKNADKYGYIPASSLGISSTSTSDQTSKIQSAITIALSYGLGIAFAPGIYVYSGQIQNSVSWIGAGPGLTEFRKNTLLGKGAPINHAALSGILIAGINFTDPNTPINAVNDATNNDLILGFYPTPTPCTDIEVWDCTFRNSYGGLVFFGGVQQGRIGNCRAYTCYKDGYHVTGLSQDVEIINCLVEDGGDDAFPVVGYVADGVRPINVSHIGCVVRGLKFSNGFKYAGAIASQNVGCKVDGTIPAKYNRATAQQSCPAMNILVDGSFNTYGNEDIQVTGFQAINCGRGASPFAQLTPAVQILGASGKSTRNIRFVNLTVKNSASSAFFANGGVAGGIENLSVEGINAIDTSDANGWTGEAGAGKFTGISIQNTHNLKMHGSLSDTGGSGIALDTTNTGLFDIDLKTYRINKGSATGAIRILDTVGTGNNIGRLKARVSVVEQANATSGNQYYVANPVYLSTPGITELLQIECDENVQFSNFLTLPFGGTSAGALGTGSTTYTNATNTKQLIHLSIGTATGATLARGQVGHFGAAWTLAGGTYWIGIVDPGESLNFTCTAVGNANWNAFPAQGF